MLSEKSQGKKNVHRKRMCKDIKQILEAVNYLHAHGVCYQDLKSQNILFSNVGDVSCLKLIDFNLSRVVDGDKILIGTEAPPFIWLPK